MAKVTLAEGIYWVGAVDWNIRNFHGYTTPQGATYNAYLIVDEKITLIDTVKYPFYEEMLTRIKDIVSPKEISYLVSNHVEMDHSSSLPMIFKETPNAQVIATERGVAGLRKHFKTDLPFVPVKEGDGLPIGKRTLKFIETPMLHWPDSMMTYLVDEGILFSMDGFGQHLATSRRFDDEVGLEIIMPEAAKYYANIVMPFAAQVLKTIDKAKTLKINMLATSHGVIWRKNIGSIIEAYIKWASGEAEEKILVIYDTMWGSTEMMAKALVKGITNEGVEVKLFKLTGADTSEIIKEVLTAKAILVGSPTLNNGIFPTVAGFLEYMRGLRPKSKIGAAFGSYGWGKGAVRGIEEMLQKTKIELLDANLEFQFVPDKEELQKCVEFGSSVAKQVKRKE
ncbi:FprA family A-type flavoprotein [Candidatus Poribacteria bacterium]|nr:FprA family A-type flavoprotein [Candidatus Poribacteria bacterium]